MAKRHGSQVGIEAQIEYHPALEKLGVLYESWRRTALNWLQSGLSENEVEKRLQSEFDLQWAWADSIATEATQTLSQLKTARANNIEALKSRIQSKVRKAKLVQKQLHTSLKKATKNGFPHHNDRHKFQLKMRGQKSIILKIESLKRDLKRLQNQSRLHICLGSRKLFKPVNIGKGEPFKNHSQSPMVNV